VTIAAPWADAVFHVLAHVEAGALAASCWNRVYVAWVAERLGAATERALTEDARVIAGAASTHDALARIQALAWLFETEDDARAATEKDLNELTENDVRSKLALAVVKHAGAEVEVLRAAAELELPLLAKLSSPLVDAALPKKLRAMTAIAPRLATCTVAVARPLGIRGRVLGSSIFVGDADVEHVVWQAAHEATVLEVSESGTKEWAELERRAIGLLRSRARTAGLAEAHALWLARFDVSGLGEIPDSTA
jgi:hypothetical protein